MGSISLIISDLEYSRSALLEAIGDLSERELTEIPIYEEWTVKDVLAHIEGWDERTVRVLPLMLQNRANEIPDIEVESFNRQSVEVWQDKSLRQLLAAAKVVHQQILDIISSMDHVEIDLRRERYGRLVTIRSYVIDVMAEHERQHAAEIEQWQRALDKAIAPREIRQALTGNRHELVTLLEELWRTTNVLDKTAVGNWSIKDLVGHIAGWEWQMLETARHIYDPSLPPVPVIDDIEVWNRTSVIRREANTWQQELDDLFAAREALDDFIAGLEPEDWRKRGPYSWNNDRGTIAELFSDIAEHDAEHLPDLKAWRKKRRT